MTTAEGLYRPKGLRASAVVLVVLSLIMLLLGGAATAVARDASRSRRAARPAAAGVTRRPTIVAPRLTTTTTAPAAPAAPVAPVGTLRAPSAIVTLPASVTPEQLRAITALRGVQAVEVVDAGTVSFKGAPANTVGVDPSTFRDFTPQVTASADKLWQYIAAGSLASSFEMSRDRQLAVGATVAVAPAGSATAMGSFWLGAFMSVGMPGVDLVVAHRLSSRLGLNPRTGLIVSAPAADPYVLQTAVKRLVAGAQVVLMRPGLALGSGSLGQGSLTAAQLSTALTAAVSRVGKPYIWGATGPDGFDCSGLVGWSFAAAGIGLPRTAAEQALAGPAVPLNRLQPGDLLFWTFDPSDPGFIDHVAIYLGDGRMIEAPQTGDVVHVIAVQRSHLVGAIRVNPAVARRLGGPWR